MKYAVCTSFNDEGYELYGKEFLRSYLENWTIPLFVYYEGRKPTEPGPTYIDLTQDRDLQFFLERYGRVREANGIVGESGGKLHIDYRYQGIKFSKKVFAFTGPRPECDWWIWTDADTVSTRPVLESFLDGICPSGYAASYLGRTEWHHSECGFVAYSMRYGTEFLKRFRQVYTSGQLFYFKEWHDSFIFDALRAEFTDRWFYNLSPNAKGLDAWGASPLKDYMIHNKGPKAKEAYAKSPVNTFNPV